MTAITIFVTGLLIYFGRRLSIVAERNNAYFNLPLYVSRTGTAFFASVVALWFYCAAIRVLSPHSSFGEFLGTFDGVAAMFFGSIIFVAMAWVISDKLGYPFAKWDKDSESG